MFLIRKEEKNAYCYGFFYDYKKLPFRFYVNVEISRSYFSLNKRGFLIEYITLQKVY